MIAADIALPTGVHHLLAAPTERLAEVAQRIAVQMFTGRLTAGWSAQNLMALQKSAECLSGFLHSQANCKVGGSGIRLPFPGLQSSYMAHMEHGTGLDAVPGHRIITKGRDDT